VTSHARRSRLPFVLMAGALVAVSGLLLQAQDTMQPTNDLPNPYETITGWAKLPAGRTWGSTSAVDIDRDGKTVWVAERCSQNSCVGSDLPPVMHFDENGNLIKAFGAGLIMAPHGIYVDRDDNIWVTDYMDNAPRQRRQPGMPAPELKIPAPGATKGHQVFKFSPDGRVLMTLGKAGGSMEAPNYLFQPSDVIVGPNGNIYVAMGHGAPVDRIVKFDKTGTFIKAWGKRGTGPGEFNQPHALAFDSQGRLFVGDRSNNRIQIFDQDGNFIAQWHQFSRPSGIFIDKDDVIYVADSESGSVNPDHGAWKRGIRIGSAKDGSVKYLIPDPDVNARGTSAAEGVAADAAGNVYGAEVGPKALKKYVKK